ncbi:MAG: NADH-quinone oxidoreductase subunit J [Gemmataceae bacterium]
MNTPPLELWHILLPVGLGLVAIYWMLPGSRRMPPVLGGLLGAVALLAAGRFLVRFEVVTVELVLFYIFSGLALLAAGLMITQRNPVHAALSFAVVVLSTCGLFLLQAAPFLMAATIIVYAGAIIVTFLFVIMLAQQSGIDSADARSREPFLSSLAGFVLLGSLIYVLQINYNTKQFDDVSARLHRALQADTAEGMKNALEEGYEPGNNFFKALRRVEVEQSAGEPVLLGKKIEISDYEQPWLFAEADGDTKTMRQVLEHLAATVQAAREMTGSRQPLPQLRMSSFAGQASNELLPPDNLGRPQLPAANVAGLGRTLFSDYLVAVELAATLLLVAVIGAIVISFRRAEAQR